MIRRSRPWRGSCCSRRTRGCRPAPSWGRAPRPPRRWPGCRRSVPRARGSARSRTSPVSPSRSGCADPTSARATRRTEGLRGDAGMRLGTGRRPAHRRAGREVSGAPVPRPARQRARPRVGARPRRARCRRTTARPRMTRVARRPAAGARSRGCRRRRGCSRRRVAPASKRLVRKALERRPSRSGSWSAATIFIAGLLLRRHRLDDQVTLRRGVDRGDGQGQRASMSAPTSARSRSSGEERATLRTTFPLPRRIEVGSGSSGPRCRKQRFIPRAYAASEKIACGRGVGAEADHQEVVVVVYHLQGVGDRACICARQLLMTSRISGVNLSMNEASSASASRSRPTAGG